MGDAAWAPTCTGCVLSAPPSIIKCSKITSKSRQKDTTSTRSLTANNTVSVMPLTSANQVLVHLVTDAMETWLLVLGQSDARSDACMVTIETCKQTFALTFAAVKNLGK